MLAIAHRGAKLHAPENTIAAFDKALELGAHAIELDVHICATGEPVVIHDKTVDRTTDATGEVAQTAARTLHHYGIPTLAQVLAHIDRRCQLFIELKSLDCAEPVADLLTYYMKEKEWHREQLVVISFFHQLLAQIKSINSRITTGASMKSVPGSLAACGEFTNSQYILPALNILSDELIKDARARKLDIITWVCDTAEDIARARALGVDGVITARPELVLKQAA